ncbi:MAG: class I SAM-dependent methyltransferase [Verrucomicrobia bacterium]|nr:class I SAM-dependent methyltransferase [Verrucomicrobiota bacterium]
MKPIQNIWNIRYRSGSRTEPSPGDPWLERWKCHFPPAGGLALDLGCGAGLDTESLTRFGFQVTAIDFAEEAVSLSRKRNPQATHYVIDIRNGIGLPKNAYSIAVANLSLHYFSEIQTRSIIGEIHQLLEHCGLFAFRVNAEDDRNSGNSAKTAAWNLVEVDGVEKQFFTKEKVLSLLEGQFALVAIEKMRTMRLGKDKIIYECIAKKSAEKTEQLQSNR